MQHPPEPLRVFADLAQAMAPTLQRVQALQAKYHEKNNHKQIPPNSIEALRIELTYNSNALEGNTLSLRETQLVIEGHAQTSGKTLREIYEARNHDRALREIESWVQTNPLPAPLTEQNIFDVHRQVLRDIDESSAGRFRSDRVLIAGTRFIPPGSHRFAELIPTLLALANRNNIDPALQAAELHYNLVAIHPFTDGNGRTARLLMNYHLLRHDYPLTIIEVAKRAEYLTALEAANAGQCRRFAALVLESLANSIERLLGIQ